eukprot:Pompholyxophrys_sp_v1_NODE_282_length_867_cov_1.538177.p1 type:complete len:238 gc:universal NODE_282_length_867_cov_1.538177:69-782(+)
MEYGLTPLHSYIRFLEYSLNIAEKMECKKGNLRFATSEQKVRVKELRNEIRQKLRVNVGIIVNQVKVGMGTTNDGNTARRFFSNVEETSRCTGLDKEFLHRLAIVLRAINSGQALNVSTFKEYSFETAKICVKLYPWYSMPATVHRVLIHGWQVQDIFQSLPVGLLSEEAGGSSHELIRSSKEHHARKDSRQHTMEDVFLRRLVLSDPFIATQIIASEKKEDEVEMPLELRHLLVLN